MNKNDLTALNNTNVDPHEVARSREEFARSRALGEAASRGKVADLAPEPAMGEGRALEDAIAAGEVRVVVPERRVNKHVELFGPESSLPRGTFVLADGTPAAKDEKPFGVIGDINTPEGKLVNRVISLDLFIEEAS
jgi:hypothetical protein